MKENIDDFIETFTTNFSELFIESFLIKYISDFGKTDIENNIFKAINSLNSKIIKKIESQIK